MTTSAALTLAILVFTSWNHAHFYVINVTTTEDPQKSAAENVSDSFSDGKGDSSVHIISGQTRNETAQNSGTKGLEANLTLILIGSDISSKANLEKSTARSQPALLENSIPSDSTISQINFENVESSTSSSSSKKSSSTQKNEQRTPAAAPENTAITKDLTNSEDANFNVSGVSETFSETNASFNHGDSSTNANVIDAKVDLMDSKGIKDIVTSTANISTNTSSVILTHIMSRNKTAANSSTTTIPQTTLLHTTKAVPRTTSTTPETTTSTTTAAPKHKSQGGKAKGHTKVGKKKPGVSSPGSHHLARHFTGFVQHVWLPNSTPRQPGPVDDGPFGSILWKDKKYLISVMIPIGVGFSGAMMIIVMAYASRAWRKRKDSQGFEEGAPRSFLEAATSKNDDMAPLQESSDDEF